MAFKKVYVQTDEEDEFITLFQQLCYSRSDWQVWSDLMSVFACSISNLLKRIPKHFEAREKEYKDCIQRLGSVEIAAKLQCPIVPGTFPKKEQVIKIENFDERIFCPEIDRETWGFIGYRGNSH